MSFEPPPEPDEDPGWPLTAAGAAAGIAAGGFLVSVLAHLHRTRGWTFAGYEPAAALLGALGVWCFTAGRGARAAFAAMAAALLAMLVGDLFYQMAQTLHTDWRSVPSQLLSQFTPANWPKLVRYAFGLYVGWYLGSGGHAQPSPPADKAATDVDEITDEIT